MYGLGGGQMVNGVYVMDSPITVDTVLPSGENVYTDSQGHVIAAGSSGGSLTQWVNANPTMAIVAGGALVVLASMLLPARQR